MGWRGISTDTSQESALALIIYTLFLTALRETIHTLEKCLSNQMLKLNEEKIHKLNAI